MPNTLVHLGVQALVTRRVLPTADARWIFLGAVIPDLPWILQRALRSLAPGLDPYDLRLYVTAQASLLFCLVLSMAFSLLSARPRIVFAILLLNATLHLLIDAVEIKWGNGVHLLAPLVWRPASLGLVWPESLPVIALTAFGLAAASWVWLFRPGLCIPVRLQSPGSRLPWAVALLLAYLAGPVLVMDDVERADSHFVATLRNMEERPGRPIELDRATLLATDSRPRVRTFAGEEIVLTGAVTPGSGTVSLRGQFVDPGTISVSAMRLHPAGMRDGPTYIGLLLFLTAWILPHLWRKGDAQPYRPPP